MSHFTNISQCQNVTNINSVTSDILNIYHHARNLSSENLQVMIRNAEDIFIRVPAYDTALQNINKYGCGIICGHSGTGKTTIALMIADYYSKQKYNIHFVGNLSFFNFQETVDPKVPTLLILDDLFGNHCLNTSIDKYIYTFDSILHHFERRQGDSNHVCLKILITSKSENLDKSVSLLPKFKDVFFIQEATVDISMSSPLVLTEDNKAAIFELHMKEVLSDESDGLKVSSLFKSIVKAENKVLGFPGLCRLFVRNFKNISSPGEFFDNPLSYLKPEMQRLMNSGDTRTTAIILLVLCNGSLLFPDFGTPETREKSGLSQQLVLLREFVEEKYMISTGIISTMRELDSVIAVSELDEVKFIHPTLFDCAAVLLAEMNLTFAIKYCSFKFIHEYICVRGIPAEFSQPFSTVSVSQSYFKLLAERLSEEIRNRNIALSLSHSSLMNDKIADLVLQEIKGDAKDLLKLSDATLGLHFLYWATFCKSQYFFSSLLTSVSPSRREMFEAAIGCCLNGNVDALEMIIKLLGPGIFKVQTIQMCQIFSELDADDSSGEMFTDANTHLHTPLAEIRQSSKTLVSIAMEYKHTAVIDMLQQAINRKTVHEDTLKNVSESGTREIINTVGDKLSSMDFIDHRGDSHLHVACHYGQLEVIRTALESDNNVLELKGHCGRTLLMTAAASGKQEIFDFLLVMGADITLTDYENNNLLHLSCIGGNIQIVESIMSLELFDVNSRGFQLWTPLHFAACNKHHLIIQLLFAKGADLTVRSADGHTALHLSAAYGDLKTVEWLVEEQSCDINAPGYCQFSPLMAATKSGHVHIAQYLLSKDADVEFTGACGCNCLHIACEEGSLEMTKLFLESKTIDINDKGKHDYPPFIAATKKRQTEMFKYLLKQGVDIFFKTKDGDNCLHIAANAGAVDIVEKLLEMKVFDIDEAGSCHQTAVMQALDNGHTDTSLLLIANNANMKLIDTKGHNCFHYACEEGMLTIIKKLICDPFYATDSKESRIRFIKLCIAGEHIDVLEYLMLNPEKIFLNLGEVWELLLMASAGQNTDVFRFVFDMAKVFKDFNIDMRSSKNQLTLLCAAGNEDIAKTLLKNGANPLLRDRYGNTLLHNAAKNGLMSIVDLLISQFGMDMNMRGAQGYTPLMNACYKGHLEPALLLLDRGAISEANSPHGYKCLHLACIGGSLEIVKKLLQISLNVNMKNKTGHTPIMLATLHNHPQIVAYLLSMGASLTTLSNSGMNVLRLACFEGQLETVKLILNTGQVAIDEGSGPNKWTPLIDACQGGHTNIVEYLISKGAKVYKKSAQGACCLHFASMSGNVSIVSRLLDIDNLHVNMRGEMNWTPLMLAASDGHYNLVEYLIDRGADVKLQNSDGSNCIHVAAKEGYLEIVELLIYKDPKLINTMDSLGTTPIILSLFFKHQKIFEFLYDNDADITTEKGCGSGCLYTACISGMREAVERLLCTGLFDIDKPAIHNWTPIMGACRGGQYETYRFLAVQGARVDLVGDSEDNIFHVACMGGNLTIVTELYSSEMFDINSTGCHGWTALFMACQQGHPNIVSFLLANGADLAYRDSRGNNCLHIACGSGHIDAVKLLLLLDHFDLNEQNYAKFTPLMQATRHGHEQLVQLFEDLKG